PPQELSTNIFLSKRRLCIFLKKFKLMTMKKIRKFSMKKLFAIIVCFVLLQSYKLNAQITLDTVVTPQMGIGDGFYLAQISPSETKYVLEDTVTNTFSL